MFAPRFRDAGARLLRTNARYVLQQGLSSPVIDFCAAAVIVGLLTYARIRIKGGELTAGHFTSFYDPLWLAPLNIEENTRIISAISPCLCLAPIDLTPVDR